MSVSQQTADRALHTLQGAGIGAIALMIAGSFWPGWNLASTTQKLLADRDRATLVKFLGPVCADRFRRQPDLQAKTAELKSVDSWRRDRYLAESDNVVKTGVVGTDESIGSACVTLLDDLLK